jgi:uncharacterized damage-inducible protein DinB
MAESAAFLAERLKTEGDKTIEYFQSLSSEEWLSTVYTEGETWSIRSVLAHYVTAEKGFISIFSSIRDGGSGVQEDFDIDRFNASQQTKTRDVTPSELLEQFRMVRAQMVALVASMSDADLARQGRHPFLGQTTLAEMIKMVYRHNQIHSRDLRKIR